MDTFKNRKNDYENENQPMKIVKSDKYDDNRKKFELWFLQLAI